MELELRGMADRAPELAGNVELSCGREERGRHQAGQVE